MLIRCWGCRGSIPVSGREYLKYGGDTTCIEIRGENGEVIIIDAGSGIRRLGRRLVEEEQTELTLLFTHAHWDHLLGFPFFEPIYRRESNIAIYGCSFMGDSIKSVLSPTMQPPHFPVHYEDISARISHRNSCEADFQVGGLWISTISLSHPNQGVGYKFEENGRVFVFLTDNELGFSHGKADFNEFRDFCRGVDLLIHDAEYSRASYEKRVSWGHSCYEDAVRLALAAKVSRLGLFHHNQESTDSIVDGYLEHSQAMVAASGANLSCFALYQGWEIKL